MLTPLYKTGADAAYHAVWMYQCSCGRKKEMIKKNVDSGMSKSCGCSRVSHGKAKTDIYRSWQNMKTRCLNSKSTEYKNYGGRGITICPRWMDFENFFEDMGEIPAGKTLDRIDNNKGYSKGNCRWATRVEQSNNLRKNVFIVAFGKRQTVSQWAREIGIDRGIILGRLKSKRKYPVEIILSKENINYRKYPVICSECWKEINK